MTSPPASRPPTTWPARPRGLVIPLAELAAAVATAWVLDWLASRRAQARLAAAAETTGRAARTTARQATREPE
jgi:hypothetical protein